MPPALSCWLQSIRRLVLFSSGGWRLLRTVRELAMCRALTIGAGVLGASAVAALGVSGWRFNNRLDELEADLRDGASPVQPRTDLPPEVLTLARRLGVT